MTTSFVSHRLLTVTSQTSLYPADLLPDLQSTLGALAEIDCCYAAERDRLNQQSCSADAKRSLPTELDRRHEAGREPYVRQLSEIQHRIAVVLRRH